MSEIGIGWWTWYIGCCCWSLWSFTLLRFEVDAWSEQHKQKWKIMRVSKKHRTKRKKEKHSQIFSNHSTKHVWVKCNIIFRHIDIVATFKRAYGEKKVNRELHWYVQSRTERIRFAEIEKIKWSKIYVNTKAWKNSEIWAYLLLSLAQVSAESFSNQIKILDVWFVSVCLPLLHHSRNIQMNEKRRQNKQMKKRQKKKECKQINVKTWFCSIKHKINMERK